MGDPRQSRLEEMDATGSLAGSDARPIPAQSTKSDSASRLRTRSGVPPVITGRIDTVPDRSIPGRTEGIGS